MAVWIVAPDGDDSHLRLGGEKEARVACRTAVVGNLQQARAQAGGCGQQVVLSRTFDVAGQERDPPSPSEAQHYRGLVLLAVGPAVGTACGWSENVQTQSPDRRASTRSGVRDRNLARLGLVEQLCDTRKIARQSRQPERPHPGLGEHGGKAIGVVGVRVAEDDEVEVPLGRAAQPTTRFRVGSPIHEDAGSRRLDEDGIALPDVDGGDDEAAHGPPEGNVREEDPHE